MVNRGIAIPKERSRLVNPVWILLILKVNIIILEVNKLPVPLLRSSSELHAAVGNFSIGTSISCTSVTAIGGWKESYYVDRGPRLGLRIQQSCPALRGLDSIDVIMWSMRVPTGL